MHVIWEYIHYNQIEWELTILSRPEIIVRSKMPVTFCFCALFISLFLGGGGAFCLWRGFFSCDIVRSLFFLNLITQMPFAIAL